MIGILSELSHERRQERMASSLRRAGHDVAITQVINGEANPSQFWQEYTTHPMENPRRGSRKLYFLRFMWAFRQLILRERPEIVLAVDPPALWAAAALKNSLGFHLVYDSREHYSELPTVRDRPLIAAFWSFIEKRGLRRCDEAFTVCASIALDLRRLHRSQPLKIVRNVPEYAYQEKSPSAHLRRAPLSTFHESLSRHPVIVYSGGFWPGYDFRPLMKALGTLGDEVNSPHLLFLGDGPGWEMHRDFANNLSWADRIHFAGKQPPDQIPALLAACDVGVIPVPDLGLSYRFLLPNKLFEYVQAGLPVLVSPLPEMMSIVLSRRLGAVAEPADEAALEKSLRTLLHKDWWPLHEKSFQQAAKDLCWEEEEKRFLPCFPEVEK